MLRCSASSLFEYCHEPTAGNFVGGYNHWLSRAVRSGSLEASGRARRKSLDHRDLSNKVCKLLRRNWLVDPGIEHGLAGQIVGVQR